MSEPSPETSHHQSQPADLEPTVVVSTGLVPPPPSFAVTLGAPPSEEEREREEGQGRSSATTLPRNFSSISIGPEACHIEDVDHGCGHEHHKQSVLHSATHTPAISRTPSTADVTHDLAMSARVVPQSGLPEVDQRERVDNDDDYGVLEMKAPEMNGHLENNQINPSTAAPLLPSPPQSETPEEQQPVEAAQGIAFAPETAPAEESPIVTSPSVSPEPVEEQQAVEYSPDTIPNIPDIVSHVPEHPNALEEHHPMEEAPGITPAPETAPEEGLTTVANPATTPELVEEEQAVEYSPDSIPDVPDTVSHVPDTVAHVPEHQNAAENINWNFDDMSALQTHITGSDPFEQLKQEAPARSSTFPPVPPHDESSTTAHYDNEKALFNMMASEIATGDGERGLFDSPSVEQGGFFGVPGDVVEEEDFFGKVSRAETIDDNVAVMMGQVLDAVGASGAIDSVEDDDAARFEEGVPLINHDQGSESENNELGDTESKAAHGVNGEGLEKKSTIHVVEAAAHPYHSAAGVATSIATVNSQVLISESLDVEVKAKDSLFDTLLSTTEEDDGDNFFSKIGQEAQKEEIEKSTEEEEDDLTARWKAALEGDVLDDEEGFLPSDDEGFLPDSDDESTSQAMAPVHGSDGQLQGFSNLSTGGAGLVQNQSPSLSSGRYTPQQAQVYTPPIQQQPYGGAAWQRPPNAYTPPQHAPFPPGVPKTNFGQKQTTGPYASFSAQPPRLPEKKAQSFVDKKEGYQSPYDLPMDVAPPIVRKRPSQLGPQGLTSPGFAGMTSPPPPARSSSMGAVFSPTVPTPGAYTPQPQKFFEELPMALPKSRTASAMGMGGRYSPGPAGQLPPRSAGGFAPPPTGPPRPGSTQGFYAQQAHSQPAMVSPQQTFTQLPSTAGTRYSPAPRQVAYAPPSTTASAPTVPGYQAPPITQDANSPYAPVTSAPPAALPKYAPRPAGPPQLGTRPPAVVGGFVPPPKPVESQDIGSPGALEMVSPTAHGQQSPEDAYNFAQRRFFNDHGMHSSRPGTARSISMSATMDVPREEEEEIGELASPVQNNGYSAAAPLPSQNRYAPSRGPGTPIPGISRANTFTPPPEATFQPPQRAQTQSPGMAFGRGGKVAQRPRDPYERPSSAFAHTSTSSHSIRTHQRAQSLQLNFMTPTDETGRDVLKRWQGAPLFTWGFGGNIAVMFPRRAHRYMSDMQQPVIKCSPGEVKIKNIKDILPLEEIEGKFPGPLWSGGKNKGKKKEALTWMGTKIEALERECEGKGTRAEEKLLLWKVVQVLLENDGVLEGNSEVEKVVRGVLTPEVVSESDNGINGGHGGSFTMVGDISANMQGPSTDRVDPEAVRHIKTNLLKGDRTAAVWHAADKRLWSHALLIAGTVGKDLWKQVVQEFVKHEVKTLGEGVESLAVLYEIFAGNWAESVDELVSASTRVGVPMLGGAPNGGVNIEEKLDRWRETLGLVLNNRSPGDSEAILALGRLLVGYGRIEAGHICYVFARQGAMGGVGAVLGGPEEQAAHYSLLGMENGTNFSPKDSDAVMLSEIYELAVSLTTTPHPAFPHLLSYKLHRAMVRAENGHKAEAQKYIDAIISAIGSGKPSVYINPVLMAAVEELNTRLSFAPKDSTSGSIATGAGKWIPKLNSETVTSSIWETFNTFVSGEKDDASTAGDPVGIDHPISGPFARMSESPTMSRVQSGVDLHSYNTPQGYGMGAHGGMKPYQQPQPQYQPQVSGKYAPQSRGSFDSQNSPYSPAVNSPYAPTVNSPYAPTANHQRGLSSDSYKPSYTGGGGYESSGNPYDPGVNSYEPKPQQQVNPYDSPDPSPNSAGFDRSASTYDSPSSFEEARSTANTTGYDSPGFASAPDTPSYRGYEPPTNGGGYEPPSNGFTPYEPKEDNDDESDEKAKPKKKGFMDDDDDETFLKLSSKVKEEESKQKTEEQKNTAAADSGTKKGWFGWFKKDPTEGPIKAKLGEESSFVFDPELKRWVNKKAGEGSSTAAPKPPPPPMKRASTPAGTSTTTAPPSRPSSVAPPPSSYSEPPRTTTPAMTPTTPTPSVTPGTPGTLPTAPPLGRGLSPAAMSVEGSLSPTTPGPPSGPLSGPPPPASKPPGSGPPSRPPTAMGGKGGDAMDDLLGPPGANVSRRSTPGVGRKARGKSRYVEVVPGLQ